NGGMRESLGWNALFDEDRDSANALISSVQELEKNRSVQVRTRCLTVAGNPAYTHFAARWASCWMAHRWTDPSSSIRICSDGRCGCSACASPLTVAFALGS